jgi:hypothetical protein
VLFFGCFATACSSGTGEAGDTDDSDTTVADVGTGDASPGADIVDPDTGAEDVQDDVEIDTPEDVAETDTPDDVVDVREDVEEDATTDVEEDATTDVEEDATTDVEEDTIIACEPGFELVEGACVDIDECETTDCGLGTCENNDGGFECLCDDGAELLDGICVDNDECADEPCGENATCTNTVEGFECACDSGFLGDGLECDEDVCAGYEPVVFARPNGDASVVDCITESVCIARGNTGPLYNSVSEDAANRTCETSPSPEGTEWARGRCAAATDFAPFLAAVECSPSRTVGQDLCLHVIAEDLYFDVRFDQFQGGGPGGGFAYTRRAASGICPIGAACEPGVLPAACECPAGFALDADLGECVDLNECELDALSCDETAVCVNTPGSFECECPAGSEFEGETCVDVDECEAMPCDENAACVNLAPDFVCECAPGFEGDGFTCEIVCDPGCAVNEVCVPGASVPVCECARGFEPSREGCVAIDFCARTETVTVTLESGLIDCVTPSVCLQQAAASAAIFNSIAERYEDIDLDGCTERGDETPQSPVGTRWLNGTCDTNADATNAEFLTFAEIGGCQLSSLFNNRYCMLSTADGIRVDFEFEYGFAGGIDLGGPSDFELTYTRSSLDSCDDSNTCTSSVDAAVCSCPGDSEPLEDGRCDLASFCDLACGDNGDCAFGEAGRLCVCDDGFHWDGATCAATPVCSGEVTYVHQPGSEGDCWTDEVCIVRDHRQSIYNAVREFEANGCSGTSPRGVLFQQVACDDIELPSEFAALSDSFGCGGLPDIVGVPLCAQIEATGELLDITFDSWVAGNSTNGTGGYGFSYTRDAASECAESAFCNAEVDTCICDDDFEGDGLSCAFVGACDLDCGANGDCVGGELGPECSCDVGYADLGEGCVDIDLCENSVVFAFSSEEIEGVVTSDCITEDVCLTRPVGGGPPYNSAQEEPNQWTDENPVGTLWAEGGCDAGDLRFGSLRDLRDNGFRSFRNVVGTGLCMQLIDTGARFDFVFTSFVSSSSAFSYTRRAADLFCGPNSTCEDNVGPATCGCEAGYAANDEGICENIDDCDANPCGEASCSDGIDTFFCACETVEFAKSNFGDEQDCVSAGLCISRADEGPLFNAAVEEQSGGDVSCDSEGRPEGTAWARGACSDARTRGPFLGATFADCTPPSIVGEPACMEVLDTGQLFNIEFDFWQSGGEESGLIDDEGAPRFGGGGFSYSRQRLTEGSACDPT